MKISLGTTYYNNPDLLKKFVDKNLPWVDELIVVDDGSTKFPIQNYFKTQNSLKIFRVTEDIGFNSHGCRNLIMKQASNEFVILLDVDREFFDTQQCINTIKNTKLRQDTLYRFIAHAYTWSESHTSVNDYLISKTHFFSAGGYDEELIGVRTGDREYFEQLLHFGFEKILFGIDIKLTRRPSTQLSKKEKNVVVSKNDKKMSDEVKKLIEQRKKQPNPNKNIITFPWEQVF